MDLTKMKCVPCEGIGRAMSPADARKMIKNLPGWKIRGKMIAREFKFKDFVGSVKFINRVMKVAESNGHHPDLHVHWNRVTVEMWTHAVGGLSQNDFVVAAKIDRVA